MAIPKQTKQKICIGIVLAAVFFLLILLVFSGDNYVLLKSLFTQELSNEELQELLKEFGWQGYIAICIMSMLQVICTFLPAEPVQVLSGFTFGFRIGLVCCMAGVILGNTVLFLLQKLFGDRLREYFIKKLGLNMEAIAQSSQCVLIVFILYFLPAIPYGMIGFFAASTGMSYRRFALVTTLGALPSVCIGVGLGYMTITSHWLVSVCVFAAMLLVVALVFWKKELLFGKLNEFADQNKKSTRHKVHNLNRFLTEIVYQTVNFYYLLCGIRVKAVNKVGKLEKPSIILCNHGSFIDFIYVAALVRKFKPNFIAARLYFYNKYLRLLLRHLGAFPKSMFATDLENAKNCLTVLREKSHLGMMPEARLSTAGRFEDIQDTTYAFLKKSGVSIYTIKLNGDYLADPKWGKGFRRGARVEAELDILYTAEQVQSLSLEELKSGIEQRLYYDEFEWLKEHPELRYRSRRMAEGLENILTVCPTCQGRHTLRTKGKKVFCEKCGYLTSLDERYAFDEGFRFENLAQWYDWQKEWLAERIAEDADYALVSKVELRLPGYGSGLTRHGGEGVCTLNRDGLTYVGTKDGEEVNLHFSLQRIYRLLFGAGENFEIYDGAEILYFVPEEKRSAVDWYLTSMILHDNA